MITDSTWEFTSIQRMIKFIYQKSISIKVHYQSNQLADTLISKGISEILKLKKNFHSADLTFRCIETDSGILGEITYDSD